MKELSLFTGAGGGLLGTMLLGWRCVGAVEFAEYPCKVLDARQKDGILDEFPIWHMDIREFNRRVAPSYTGMVDVITAGFPCQPFSVAGKQLAADDSRNMWPATNDAIRIVKPRYVFLENVPGIISSGYIVTVINDLRAAGYQVLPPLRLSASDVGANHKRERVWIVGYAISKGLAQRESQRGDAPEERQAVKRNGCEIPDAKNANDTQYANKQGKRQSGGNCTLRSRQQSKYSWWQAEPDVDRVADELAFSLDKPKAITKRIFI